MSSVPDHARLETKFVTYSVNLSEILHWVRLHPMAFHSPFPDRWVNNVYFDTYGSGAYVQNLTGASARSKVRYRWYGAQISLGPGVLEVKRKRNFFGWKLRFECERLEIGHNDDWRRIKRRLMHELPHEGRLWLETYPVPMIINRYQRRYFVSSDDRIRVTVDTDQAVWDQRFKPSPNYDHAANLPDTLVVEIKFSRADRDLASDLMRSIPVRVSRHSKYINGVRAVSFG